MEYGCIGEKLPHSFSKEIHEKIGGYAYELCELTPEALPAFLTARPFRAINVTIPYKQAVIPYLSHVSERARAIGAVNTIVNRGGALWGYNTDFAGMTALIGRMGLSLAGKTVLILGTGGTSRTAAAVAAHLGAAAVRRVSRSGRDGALTYEEAAAHGGEADVLLNTTPCGMYPHPDEAPVSLNDFPHLCGVVDAIYNPLASRLVLDARARGIPAEGGLYMLVAQAVEAAAIFTGDAPDASVTERIYGEILTEKRSVVLIGMPGSGKSTIGRLLAARLGRPLIDTDAEIVAAAGMPITEIFAREGEGAFRALESRVIREISARGGAVIATGGGAVLREENVRALRQNGRLFWLDRPLEQLLPTDDRPLADSAEKIRALYGARMPIYRAAADAAIAVDGDAERAAEEIMRNLI